jgi:D-3-phosphoglycerate dehydrogenase
MPQYGCAVLDDYQNVAMSMGDWSTLADDIKLKVFNEHLGGADNVVKALADFEIICAMRERTPFPRAVIEKLPKLKLLITTGMRNASIDVAAAKERGIAVCGTPTTGNPTSASVCAHARARAPRGLRERVHARGHALAKHDRS